MNKVVVYSHDTCGLGNIRRMLSICQHLLDALPDLSILLLTGSPLVHEFRLPQRLDYIKLPSLRRTGRDSYSTRYLGTEVDLTVRLRSRLILTAVAAFKPDLMVVDKKPLGLKSELKRTLAYLKKHCAQVRHLLVLRDILDSPEATIRTWETNRYSDAICQYYDGVAVLGSPEIFDIRKEYRLPDDVASKTRFCGYVRRGLEAARTGEQVRRDLSLREGERLALVTAGGGEDCRILMDTYLASVPLLSKIVPGLRSVVIHGPELAEAQKQHLSHLAEHLPNVTLRDFTVDLESYMAVADVVVSMGGYNTVCEILSLGKRAIVVPRVRPVEEQLIRARRMEALGLFRTIHPDKLTPATLARAVAAELLDHGESSSAYWIDMNALPRITHLVRELLTDDGEVSHADAVRAGNGRFAMEAR